MHDQTEIAQAQRRTGEPWNQRWNWLLGKPDVVGVARRWYLAVVFTLIGLFNGVLRFTPFLGPPENSMWPAAANTALSILGVVVYLSGVLYAWSAVRLQRYRRAEAG